MCSLVLLPEVVARPNRAEIRKRPRPLEVWIGLARNIEGSQWHDVIDMPLIHVVPSHSWQELPLKVCHQLSARIANARERAGASSMTNGLPDLRLDPRMNLVCRGLLLFFYRPLPDRLRFVRVALNPLASQLRHLFFVAVPPPLVLSIPPGPVSFSPFGVVCLLIPALVRLPPVP